MEMLVCKNCGGKDFYMKDGYRVCSYCETRYVVQQSDMPARTSTIDLNDDITRLLQKCQDDPAHARRYANLVLDLDPDNSAALKYL